MLPSGCCIYGGQHCINESYLTAFEIVNSYIYRPLRSAIHVQGTLQEVPWTCIAVLLEVRNIVKSFSFQKRWEEFSIFVRGGKTARAGPTCTHLAHRSFQVKTLLEGLFWNSVHICPSSPSVLSLLTFKIEFFRGFFISEAIRRLKDPCLGSREVRERQEFHIFARKRSSLYRTNISLDTNFEVNLLNFLLNSVAQQPIRAKAYCFYLSIRETHKQMPRLGGQSEAKPPVFSPQISLVLVYRPTEEK
ncbi:hypothetical protein TNCV_1959851 [Trichonephila clavipes]|nr:hypothetical protein TNCV_1959851 [Trichonephila clavipes]